MTTEAYSFEELVDECQASVWAYLRMLGCDPAQADDLTQETLVSVMNREFERRSRASTNAFLRQRAKFLFLKSLRGAKRREARERVYVVERVWMEWTPTTDWKDTHQVLQQCLDTLDERDRRAVMLHYAHGVEREAIAREFELKLEGVKSLLKRVKATLRECIQTKLGK